MIAEAVAHLELAGFGQLVVQDADKPQLGVLFGVIKNVHVCELRPEERRIKEHPGLRHLRQRKHCEAYDELHQRDLEAEPLLVDWLVSHNHFSDRE